MEKSKNTGIGFFEKYLTLWVALCMVVGVLIGCYTSWSRTMYSNGIRIVGLLLTLVIIFSFQGDVILGNPLHIVLIAIPPIIQTFIIFFIAYLASKALRLPHYIAAPAGMIGASNFFELAVAAK